IANQIVGPLKIDRLFKLQQKVEVIAAIESEFNLEELEHGAANYNALANAIIEVDTGMHRCGTTTPEQTVALARRMSEGPVRYRGIMGYEGHAVLIADPAEREQRALAAMRELSRQVEALRAAGLAPEIV